MSLKKKIDYRFINVGEFEDGKTLLGDEHVFSQRKPEEQYVIRAEDYAYLIEGLKERMWLARRNVADSGEIKKLKDDIDPKVSGSFFVNKQSWYNPINDAFYYFRNVSPQNGYFMNGTPLSNNVDDTFPIGQVVVFNSLNEATNALGSVVETIDDMSLPTAYGRVKIESVELMKKYYDNLARLNRVCGSVEEANVGYSDSQWRWNSKSGYIDLGTTTGTTTGMDGNFMPVFDAQVDNHDATVRMRKFTTSDPYVNYPRSSNYNIWFRVKIRGVAPTGEIFPSGSYAIYRIHRSYALSPFSPNQVVSGILRRFGFSGDPATDAKTYAQATMPIWSLVVDGIFQLNIVAVNYEFVTGALRQSTQYASFFKAAFPPFTY